MKDTTTLIKDKELFISYAKDHTIPQEALATPVTNVRGSHKILPIDKTFL